MYYMVTIADVAKKANVSKMTVSRVLNHPGKVSKELRQLVEQTMQELGYEQNYIAKSLVNNQTRVVRYIVSEDFDVTEPYFMNLLAGISQGLSKKYYSLQVVRDISLQRSKVDGIIYTGIKTEHNLTELICAKIPIIFFGQTDNFDFVDVDNYQGIKKATEYLLQKHLDKIFFLGIDREEPFALQRLRGFETCEKKIPSEVIKIKNSATSSRNIIIEILRNARKNYQKIGFVCATDRIALGVIQACQYLQVKIPNQVEIIGFDGVLLDQIAHPKLTTMKQPLLEMGERLAEIIIEKIEAQSSEKTKTYQEYFRTSLIVRETTST